MRALILGGGYGTRLERDLRNDASGAFQHLIGVPKPLMPIGEKPLISHWMESLKNVDKSNQIEIYVVVSRYRILVFVSSSYSCYASIDHADCDTFSELPSRHRTLNQCWFNIGPAS